MARIKLGIQQQLTLAKPRRDRRFAVDHGRATHLMLRQNAPEDYVVATGGTPSVAESASPPSPTPASTGTITW